MLSLVLALALSTQGNPTPDLQGLAAPGAGLGHHTAPAADHDANRLPALLELGIRANHRVAAALALGLVGASFRAQVAPPVLNSRALPSLLVYDFNLNKGPAGNADHVEALGFDGIVTRVADPADLIKLSAYATHVDTMPGFELLAFVPYDFFNSASPQVWREALPILAAIEAPLWVIVRNAPSDTAVRQLLVEMATESKAVGIPTVLYPHWNTNYDSAAEAADLIRDIGDPNLKNSLHTCHEIRSGNQYTLENVVSKHAEVSALVTIAGADANAYAGPPTPLVNWSDAIKPLDKGAFSLLPFLQALHDSGYDGPVVLHTFGITNDPGHLQRSLREYVGYLRQVTQ